MLSTLGPAPLALAVAVAIASTSGGGHLVMGTRAPLERDIPLNEAPFVMSHNSATGYLPAPTGTPLENARLGWLVNQQAVTFTEQMECGVRAFDLRLAKADNGAIIFRHGDVLINQTTFRDSLVELKTKATSEPNDELILLKIGECTNASQAICNDEVVSILREEGITFVADCATFANLTVGAAINLGAVEGANEGAPILAVKGYDSVECIEDYYNSSVTCWGIHPDSDPDATQAVKDCVPPEVFEKGIEDLNQAIAIHSCLEKAYKDPGFKYFQCWDGAGLPNELPNERMGTYLNSTLNAGPPPGGLPWQLQGLWQIDEVVILLGTMQPGVPLLQLQSSISSIVKDLDESNHNEEFLELVKGYVSSNITLNLVEVDQVCDDFGKQLIDVLRPEQALQVPTAAPFMAPPTPTSSGIGPILLGHSAIIVVTCVLFLSSFIQQFH